jgi:gentisate 1,2-dioxygenase
MNTKEHQSQAMIAPAAQVKASASTKIQKESYSFHEQPYFKTPSWQKMTVAVSRTGHERTSKWK